MKKKEKERDKELCVNRHYCILETSQKLSVELLMLKVVVST